MGYRSYQVKPNKTPNIIKYLLLTIATCSLLISVIPNKFLLTILGLSSYGIKHFFLWQIVTNLFIIPNIAISFGFVIHLGFSLYIIWMFSSSIIDIKGNKHFIYLLTITGILSSLFALCFMHLFSYSIIFAGNNIMLYAISIAWLMINGDAKLLLFFALPFKAKWLVLGLLSLNLISLLSNGAYLHFFTYLFAGFIAYIFSLIVWKTHSPFDKFIKFEKKIINLFKKHKFKNFDASYNPKSKVYDFSTGEPIIEEEDFMDAMLAKISKYGKESLSKKEIKRMNNIAKRKKSF